MYLTALRLDGFRNIKIRRFFPAAGSTSFSETTLRAKPILSRRFSLLGAPVPFGGAKEAELIPFGQDF